MSRADRAVLEDPIRDDLRGKVWIFFKHEDEGDAADLAAGLRRLL